MFSFPSKCYRLLSDVTSINRKSDQLSPSAKHNFGWPLSMSRHFKTNTGTSLITSNVLKLN